MTIVPPSAVIGTANEDEVVMDRKDIGAGVAEITIVPPSAVIGAANEDEVVNVGAGVAKMTLVPPSAVIGVAKVDSCIEAAVGLNCNASVLHVVCTTVEVAQSATRKEVDVMACGDVDGEGLGCGRLSCLFLVSLLIWRGLILWDLS